MGIEVELGALLAVQVLGSGIFAVFEVETPAWRKILKWTVVIGATLALARRVGHWSLLLPAVLGLAGVVVHFIWCARQGIHPLHATPRRRYYALRGWAWRE